MELKKTFKNKQKFAFTLAEVVIVMGILGVMMVAFAPVISKRTTSSAAAFKNFRPMGTHNGIYFGSAGDDKTVIIGGNNIEQSYSLNPKLMLINSLKNAGGAPSFPTGVTVGLGSITVSTNPSNLLDLWNVRLHPQIAFATKAGDEIVPQGQLLVTPTGNHGSIVLGGRVDEPYRMQKLKDATIIGANACIDDTDLMDGSSAISGVVCLGAHAGKTSQTAPQPWTNTSEAIRNLAMQDATNEANASWQNHRWLLCKTDFYDVRNVRLSYSSLNNAYDYVNAHHSDNQNHWPWDIPQSYYNAWATESCWIPTWMHTYSEKLSMYTENENQISSSVLLAGTNNNQRIYIGNSDLQYTLDNVYLGANNLETLIINKLQDPHILAPILKPYLWTTAVLAMKGVAVKDWDTNDTLNTIVMDYDKDTISTNIDNNPIQNKVMWHLYRQSGGSLLESTSAPPFGGYVQSDRRLKNVGELFKGGLEQISKLQIFNYTYKNDENKTPHIGVMAQDLQEVFPDAVKENEEGFLYIRTEDMFYAGLNAIKELYEKVLDHETRIQQLEKRVDELELMLKKYENLEKRLNKIDKKVSRRADKKQAKLQAEVEELTQPLKADE